MAVNKTIAWSIDQELAQAIIDMENHGYSEGLGPKSKEGFKEWNKLVLFVAEEFDLQDKLVCKVR